MKDRTRAALILLNEGWSIDEVNAVLRPEGPVMTWSIVGSDVAPGAPLSPTGHWQKFGSGTGGVPTWVWVEDQSQYWYVPVQ